MTRTFYPLGAYALRGLAWQGDRAILVDTYRGHLLSVDPQTEDTRVLNRHQRAAFVGVTDLAIEDGVLWVARRNAILYGNLDDCYLYPFVELPVEVFGLAVSAGAVYASVDGYIAVLGRATRGPLRKLPLPGAGDATLAFHNEKLWAADRLEETVYGLDPKTGEIEQRALTPFADPRGVGFWGEDLYVLYAGDEYYVRDNPNDPDNPYSVDVRDRAVVNRLEVITVPGKPRHTLSNGYLVEMVYLEELSSEDPQPVHNLNWRIALPANTDRQKVLAVEPVGMPFELQGTGDRAVAVFPLGNLAPDEAGMFGWRALLELRGIKYEVRPEDVDNVPLLSPEMQAEYLIDDDDLGMNLPEIRQAAREAVGDESNILLKMLKIRNYVYDRLEYRLTPYIDGPAQVLARGTASCGEYVGLLLALARLNGIACRTVGRYKCPPQADALGVPLHQYYNHVWIEFYIPGLGWLPMESNPDDTGRPPYPTRFFMGLPWYHVEIGKEVSFESIKPQPFSIGELAVNHVRFRIVRPL